MASSKDKAATTAAENKAEELGVNVGKVEGSGKDGSVTVADVEAASQEPERFVKVKLANPLARSSKASDGITYYGGEPVPESYFDTVLAKDTGLGGARLFKKGGSA